MLNFEGPQKLPGSRLSRKKIVGFFSLRVLSHLPTDCRRSPCPTGGLAAGPRPPAAKRVVSARSRACPSPGKTRRQAGQTGPSAKRREKSKQISLSLSLSTYWRLGRARRRRSSPRSGTALPEGDPRLPPRSARAASDCCDRAVPPPPRVFFRPWTGRRSTDR